MKTLNKIVPVLFALPLLASLIACEKDADYNPAPRLTTAQVYFPNNADTIVGLERAADSFYVEIDRQNTNGDLTVALKSSQDTTNTFSLPNSVTFKDGESKAFIGIAYNSMDMEYDEMHAMTISIAEDGYTTPYGDTSYSFKAGLQAPWSEWSLLDMNGNEVLGSLGTGTYTYSLVWADTDKGVKAFFHQNTLNPEQAQFLIQRFGEGVQLLINAQWSETYGVYLLSVAPTYTGLTDDTYGPVYVEDLATYQGIGLGYQEWFNYPSTYDPATGRFNLCLIYYVDQGYFGYGFETFQMDGFYVYDYSVSASYIGLLRDPQDNYFAVIDVNLGPDVVEAKYGMDDASVSESTLARNIDAEKVDYTTITEGGRLMIPLSKEGCYRWAIVTYDKSGSAHEYASCAFEYESGGSQWKDLGIGAYRDDYLTTFYQIENQFYEVEVEENATTPGLYRLVYPYGEAFPLNDATMYDTSMNYYFEIHAEDPQGVYINKQAEGLNWGSGIMQVWSYAGYYMDNGYSLEEVKAGGLCGTLENEIITFPTSSLLICFPEYKEKFFSANDNGQFILYLPDAYAELVKAQKMPLMLPQKMKGYSMRNNLQDMSDKRPVHLTLKTDKDFPFFPMLH